MTIARRPSFRELGRSIRSTFATAAYWPKTIRLLWATAPGWTLAWITVLVVQGLLPAVIVYLIKEMVDSLVAAIDGGPSWEYTWPALVWLGATAGAMLVTEIFGAVGEWIRVAQSELIHDEIRGMVHQQSARLDLSYYESSEYYDSLHQAQNEAGARSLALLENTGALTQNSITLLAMAAVLLPYGVWIPFALLASTLPAFVVVLYCDRRYHRWWERATADRRWVQYFDAMLTVGEAAAEVRLFGLAEHFRTRYQALRRKLRIERLRHLRHQAIAKFGAGAMGLVVAGAVMLWMVWRAFHGLATLGDLALFYQAFSRGQGLMRALLGSVGKILSNSLYIGNLYRFLELDPRLEEPELSAVPPPMLERAIVFRNVSFRYPGCDRYALEKFDLEIPARKTVAIVGPNGAGKTTMLKLLCRFYDPESGSIELDGTDLRCFATEDLRRLITVLFQTPLPYHATARDNIALGAIDRDLQQSEIEAAARAAGAHEVIEKLPDGYDTLLGRWFADGMELSGGERQRVAMARAYVRQSPILVLDEPTSFMDSWAEADWFKRFRRLVGARTAVIITHRFTVAMQADLIYVMEDGVLVESGTHSELVRAGGLYAVSWTSQQRAACELTEPVSERIEQIV